MSDQGSRGLCLSKHSCLQWLVPFPQGGLGLPSSHLFPCLPDQYQLICLLPWFAAVTPDTALSLEGRGRLDYHLSQAEKRDFLLRRALRGPATEPFGVDSLEVKFRTRSENGVLMHVQGSSNYTTVKVRD